MSLPTPWRKTTQHLMPGRRQSAAPGQYDIYPSFSLGAGAIEGGFDALALLLARARQVTIDGFPGVLWQDFQERLHAALYKLGVRTHWINVDLALKPEAEIDRLIAPYLGGDDPIFGFRYPGELLDLFDPSVLAVLQPAADADLTVLYGCGAALAGWAGTLVYVDVPKNEIQFRQRAGSVTCLGARAPLPPKPAYKRSYFVDWVVANRHKCDLYSRIDWFVDSQRPEEITVGRGADLRRGFDQMANNYFRVRPWFEPGPWGGQWIRKQVPGLSTDVPNYAWSFELIVPENGLVFESDGWLLELSFDFLMYRNPADIVGDGAAAFGYEFPIRFDFLDTFDGGNLSVQCHPRPDYIRRYFGELFTQDETYYILDCEPGARCYLGFQEDIVARDFRQALERSFREASPLDAGRFVQSHPVRKHDLLLIPNGTIHCSGVNNMVLEISATPYIFTFKMYDWMRLDLDGQPRPLNIERAFENLYFERKGAAVPGELIAQPKVIGRGAGWELIHLPTHRHHFYDVQRYAFSTQVDVATNGSCQVMSLVEGQAVVLETAGGLRQRFAYAETFVVPAAAERFRLISEDGAPVQVIKSFVKPREQWVEGVVA
ncbi:MAG: class I mannose-6-phosphate isomerase [Caldilineaceae bacterium]|nr:class I mannose-6-phosphate isomerase [Caldilineaceae bacterium]